jgi:serine/threonine protein kinase/Flp pilus assembly protein TadD
MSEDRLAELVVESAERLEREGPAALDAICRENPEQAVALREALAPLLAFGIVGSAQMPSDRPSRIGEFAILRELGRGGMGVVYEATQESLGRSVALKVLTPAVLGDAAAVARFKREGETAGMLRHAGIAQVYAVGYADGLHYLAMECIDGAPLDRVLGGLRELPVGMLRRSSLAAVVAEFVRPQGADPVPARGRTEDYVTAIVEIGAQVARALACAHEHGVVHRDVKPSNVLLRLDGSAVLTDFGLARHRDDPSLTRTGVFAGTPFFTSPEQAAGRADVDHRTDLFSLGALLYELLTLQLPFPGGSGTEVLRAIQLREPQDPRRLNRSVPADLVAILQRALEKEPARRYQSAMAFAEDLQAFLEHRPVVARPISPLGRVHRWALRKPLQATLAGLLTVGTPLVIGLSAYAWTTHEQVAEVARQQRIAGAKDDVLRGYIALGEGRREDAVALLRGALAVVPEDVEAWAGLAQASIRQEGAGAQGLLAEFAARPTLLASSRSLQRCRAELLAAVGKQEEATQALEHLGAPVEPLESFWVGMQRMNKALGNDDIEQRRSAYQFLLDAVVQSRSARPAFLYWLAVAAGELGLESEARRAAAALERLWPESEMAWGGAGLALFKVDPPAAILAYRRALAIAPDSLSVRNNLANALADNGQRAESIAELREIVKRKPDYAIAHYNLGRALFYENDFAAALLHLQKAVDLAPAERRQQHYLAWCLQRMNRYTEALAASVAAIKVLPADGIVWRDRARSEQALGQDDAALASAQKAAEVNPGDAANHDLLATLYAARGDQVHALASYERVVELSKDPEDRGQAREELASFLLGKNGGPVGPDPARGLKIAEELAAESERKDAWSLNLLAYALAQNGDLAGSLRELDAALALLAAATQRSELRLRETVQKSRAAVVERIAKQAAGDNGR